jgi:Fur family ferric uptake transcriptional regulator
MKTQEQLYLELRAKGFRLTPQREQVIDIFYRLPNGDHLSAEALYNILKHESVDVSLATSYRTLKLLASVGVLREVDFGGDQKHYELLRADEAPHHHLICMDCGATEEFESEVFATEATAAAATLGYKAVDLQVKLYASCLKGEACPTLKQRMNG